MTVRMRSVVVNPVDPLPGHRLILIDRPRPDLGTRTRIVAGGQRRQRTDPHCRSLTPQIEHGSGAVGRRNATR
ncbi:hypothetical protein [Rhodococcus oxybenzonivorans]|uniref:hypothetical protein n=1 Tax=Rhodococcus oxybenzonivorans TaxID=1990687 RepID=UPI0037CB666F